MKSTSKLRAMMLRGKKKKTEKTAAVEGTAPRHRLDKPMRRAEGGRISEDSKQEAARLREEAASDRRTAGADAATGLGAAIAGTGLRRLGTKMALRSLMPTKAGLTHYLAGTAAQGLGAVEGVRALSKSVEGANKDREARRIERSQVKEGEEDRAKGGRVKKC